MVPNSPTLTGKDAIGKAMKDVLADPNWSLALQPVQVEVSRGGDLGYTRGTYVLTATDPARQEGGHGEGAVCHRLSQGSGRIVEGRPADQQRGSPGDEQIVGSAPELPLCRRTVWTNRRPLGNSSHE